MATLKQIEANRLNAQKSAGPKTETGKAVTRLNAVRHGVLSSVAVAIGEDQELFDSWLAHLAEEFQPATPLEQALVEKIAVALWRSRRLLQAEAAAIAQKRRPERIARTVSHDVSGFDPNAVSPEDLEEYPAETLAWNQAVLKEMPAAEGASLAELPKIAPTIFDTLKEEAEDDRLSVEAYLAQSYEGDLAAYLAEFRRHSVGEVRKASERPRVLELALHAINRTVVPSLADAQLIARYQTMLDNQLLKTLAALRSLQAARIDTVEAEPPSRSPSGPPRKAL